LVHSLRSALKLLVEADHDYKGHRALAAEEVHKALKELGAHHRKEGTAGGATTTGSVTAKKSTGTAVSKDGEAQATSDSQLRQAQQILQGALAEMSTHPGAAANVKAAIAEINTALSLKNLLHYSSVSCLACMS
jgi:hypothetical protein